MASRIPPGGFAPVVRRDLPPQPYYVGEASKYRIVSPYYDMVRTTFMGGPRARLAHVSALGEFSASDMAAKALPFALVGGLVWILLRQLGGARGRRRRHNPRRRNPPRCYVRTFDGNYGPYSRKAAVQFARIRSAHGQPTSVVCGAAPQQGRLVRVYDQGRAVFRDRKGY